MSRKNGLWPVDGSVGQLSGGDLLGSDLQGVLPKACFNWEDQGSLGDFEQEDFG
ncbi:MAG: hypothetical protein WA183_04745 [Chthoniobacterales bacterium]